MEDHAGAEETNKKEEAAEEKSGKQRAAETNCCALTTPASPTTSPKGLSITCSDNKGSGDQQGGRRRVWNEVEAGERERGFFLKYINMSFFFPTIRE